MTGGQSSQQVAQQPGPVLALANEQGVSWSKKKPKRALAEQYLVDESLAELPSADQGDQTEQPLAEQSTRLTVPPVWLSKLKNKGCAVTLADSVYTNKDYFIGFNTTKGLLLLTDMKRHEELSDLKVLRSVAKSIVLVSM